MDHYIQFLKEKRAGKYNGCKYPNLVEIYGGMPTSYFAEVTDELMLAVFRGEEDLTEEELYRITHYNCIPFSVLKCPERIMLDPERWKHRKMIAEVDNLCIRLKCMARNGNVEAERYVGYADSENQRFLRAAYNNELSYCHYLTAKETISQYISWSTPKPEKRGITPVKGGVAV